MSTARRLLWGSASNTIRIAFTSIASLALPPVLTRTLSTDSYSAWVTLVQVSTYVALLDLGLQTVVARFIAEYHARGDLHRAMQVHATAVRVLMVGAALGLIFVGACVAAVPLVFPDMPSALYGETRSALLIVGIAAATALPFGPFASSFTGLQRYTYPTVLAVVSRLVQAGAVVLAALSGGGIIAMAVAFASVSIATSIAQYVGWSRLVRDSLGGGRGRADRSTATSLLAASVVIALWTFGGLFVSGLDTIIVGHFDFAAAGAFAVASAPVSLLLSVVSGIFTPLLPAAAALQGIDARSAAAELTIRATRYCVIILGAAGAMICVFAYPALAIWVGESYAEVGAPLLRLLVLGNTIRMVGLAYSLVVIARGMQRSATFATLSEAVVNLTVSIILAQLIGAPGAAIGTIVGAAVSIALHFFVSMRRTFHVIPVRRRQLLIRGLVAPALTYAPLLILLFDFHGESMIPANPLLVLLAVVASSVLIWRMGLTAQDRMYCRQLIDRFKPGRGEPSGGA